MEVKPMVYLDGLVDDRLLYSFMEDGCTALIYSIGVYPYIELIIPSVIKDPYCNDLSYKYYDHVINTIRYPVVTEDRHLLYWFNEKKDCSGYFPERRAHQWSTIELAEIAHNIIRKLH